MTMLARIDAGSWPKASELLALDLESGVPPDEAQRHAARYDTALKAMLVEALAPHAAARKERLTGEASVLDALRSFSIA